MLVRPTDKKLDRLETDARFAAGFGRDVAKAFRKRMQFIRAAKDERDFYSSKGLHYEKLKGHRKDERSMRLNDQFRLILNIDGQAEKVVVVVSVEDYH